MKEKKTIIRWVKEHKKELIIAGVGIAAVIAAVLIIRNRVALKAYWHALSALLKKTTPAVETVTSTVDTTARTTQSVVTTRVVTPHKVNGHVRTLPIGHHASPNKIATALENGFDLLEGQTWVADYSTGVMVA